MNILLCSAEVTPFAKAGGLADMAASLSKDLAKLGHNVMLIMPKYGDIDTNAFKLENTGHTIGVPMGTWMEYCGLWRATLPGSKVTTYFIQSAEYFDREGIYGNPDGFGDNDRRYIFFSRAVFEIAKVLDFSPDIIHAHDYHTALTMPFLKIHYKSDPHFFKTAGVYTIHNMAFHGMFEPQQNMFLCGFGEFFNGSWFEYQGAMNFMKAGILFADKITTVSPTYAQEIRFTSAGEGLQSELNQRGPDVIGVLNGVDYSEWNPERDKLLPITYSKMYLGGKKENKRRYLAEHGVHEGELMQDLPMLGIVARLTDQKGIDLLEKTIEGFIQNGIIRFTMLGTGSKQYESYFQYLAAKYSTRSFVHIGYNNTISHRLIASCDFLLVPSKFEPCGLTQLYALKYGTIPIVRHTGGLADTIQEYDPASGKGNGIVFHQYSPEDFAGAIRRAVLLYNTQPHWNQIIQNAFGCDYSAKKCAERYTEVYAWALEKI
ncbi:MAG: glycogen/starch synthase [Bacteroidota bacterium]